MDHETLSVGPVTSLSGRQTAHLHIDEIGGVLEVHALAWSERSVLAINPLCVLWIGKRQRVENAGRAVGEPLGRKDIVEDKRRRAENKHSSQAPISSAEITLVCLAGWN